LQKEGGGHPPLPTQDVTEAYFSAYDVALDMINNIEALLVRVYANGLLNARMEKFNHSA